MEIEDVIAVIDSERAVSLSLSKGGWEGWLQCELWGYLSLIKKKTVEREAPYPRSRERCDLVEGVAPDQLWIEVKAFGIFREGDADQFLDSIARDVYKLEARPNGSRGMVLVIVPKGIREAFTNAILQRRWTGFNIVDRAKYVDLYYLTL